MLCGHGGVTQAGKDPSGEVSLPQEGSEESSWLSDSLRIRCPPLSDLHPGSLGNRRSWVWLLFLQSTGTFCAFPAQKAQDISSPQTCRK